MNTLLNKLFAYYYNVKCAFFYKERNCVKDASLFLMCRINRVENNLTPQKAIIINNCIY